MLRHWCYLLLSALTINAQVINIKGKVTTQGGARPLPTAKVTLVSRSQSGSCDATGAYSITSSTSVTPSCMIPQVENVFLKNGVLEFHLSEKKNINVDIFDIKGSLIKNNLIPEVNAGVYIYNIAANSNAAAVSVIHATIGNSRMTFRYLYGINGGTTLSSSGYIQPIHGKLGKITAVTDSLRVTATGHTPRTIAITSYDTTVNITLDSLPGPSAGCGKKLSTLKSGTYTITSAGLNRTYIIDIPKNYDPNYPHRLIFGMHCMCGSMWSVNEENFYEIKRCADSANIPCIFVAPSVYNNGNYNRSSWGCPVWDQREKDHTFFDDMLKLFKDSLCVDTTRVFSVGFSYGAMFTNSLAQSHQKQLRAVVCYAASLGGGIYVPTNTKQPIAFMGCVGLSDTRCPPSDGRACRDIMLKNNGLTTTEVAQETSKGSKTHVIYDYKGVDPKYPVKWCTFDGDHQWAPVDGTSSGWDPNKTWTPKVAWNFIKQF